MKFLAPRYGWPLPKLEQFRCTLAMAYAMALPGALENAAIVLGLSQLKDDVGKRLMLRMCRPRAPRKNEPPGVIRWWDDPADLARLVDYCKNDVVVERAIFDRLLPLNDHEQQSVASRSLRSTIAASTSTRSYATRRTRLSTGLPRRSIKNSRA